MKPVYFIVSVIFLTCSNKAINVKSMIKGEIKNLPAAKVYLTDAYDYTTFLDSSDYINDRFSFDIDDKSNEPFVASIFYAGADGKLHPLLYENYALSTKDKVVGTTAFMVEKGITKISGFIDTNKPATNKLKISAGKQTDALYATERLDFGVISKSDTSANRKQIVSRYVGIIKGHPYSYQLIRLLYRFRPLYKKEELKEMLQHFDQEILASSWGKKFDQYFDNLPTPGEPVKDFSLKNYRGNNVQIIDHAVKLNMVIFWASWCGPCRQEIPKLKQIFKDYSGRGLRMVSVSIDAREDLWKTAVEKEQMPWDQLLTEGPVTDQIQGAYNFSSIPLIVFINNMGIEVARLSGYDPNEEDKARPIIEKFMQMQ